MVADFLVELLGGLIGGELGDRLFRRRSRSVSAQGRIVCAIRVKSGHVHGASLGPEWRVGTADLSPGLVVLDGMRISVTDVDTSARRTLRGEEVWWSHDPDPVILELRVSGATLEWAVPECQIDRALDLVNTAALG